MTNFVKVGALANRASLPHRTALPIVVTNFVSWRPGVGQTACDFFHESWPRVSKMAAENAQRYSIRVMASQSRMSKNELLCNGVVRVQDEPSNDRTSRRSEGPSGFCQCALEVVEEIVLARSSWILLRDIGIADFLCGLGGTDDVDLCSSPIVESADLSND